MQIHNAIITGSFSYNGADLSNVTSSNAYSASLSSRTTDLESTSSVLVGASSSFSSILSSVSSSQQQISASLLQVSASYIALSGSYNTFSGSASTRVTQIEQVYATTGSNSFRATQSITGSLTVTGQIIAQTINVQQVTSSIIYSSGSNVFGCDLNSRQTFTGSVLITGSLTIAGASSATSYSGTTIYGSTAVCSAIGLFSGCVGIGKTPSFPLDVCGFTGDAITAKFARGASECNFYISSTNNQYVNLATEGSLRFNVGVTTNCPYSSGTSAMIITSAGNVLLNNTFGGAQMVIADSAKSGNGTPFTLSSTDASNQMQLVFGRVTSCYFSIQSVEQSIGYRNLILNAYGGNVGIATTTPSQPLQLGDVSVISQDANSMYVGANFGNATGGCYIKSQYANQIHFDSAVGAINFKVAVSGNLGCTISYTTAMSITCGGNIGIGTTSPLPHAAGGGGLVVKGLNNCRGIIEVWDGSCGKAVFQQVGGTTYIGNLDKGTSGGSLRLLVNGSGTSATEAMVITCAGRVLINNSAPQNTCADYSRMTISGAYAKTNNCTGFLGSVLHLTSCENDYPFGVKFAIYGDTCSTSRYVGIQTGDHNISNQGNIVFQPSGGRVGIGNSLPSYGLDVCGTVRLTNGSTAQNVIISSTNGGSTATTLQISNSSNSAFNDGVKMIQGGGILRFHDLSDNALLGFDLTNTRVGVLTTSPGRALDVNGDSTLRGNNYINSSKMIQWEGGAYWSWRSVTSATEFQAYRGDTGAVPFLINNSNTIKLNGSFENNATVGTSTYTLDTMNGYQSIANGGYVDFSGMSGVLFVNNWSNGGVTIWLLGGGNTVALGSVIAQVGTAHHNPGVGGYRWCNNYGSTANFGFQIFRTRNTA